MAYVEKKIIHGKTYYYLTTTQRIKGRFKKTRRYIGKDGNRPEARPKYLTNAQGTLVRRIQKNYLKKHKMDKTLWKTEKKRFFSFVYNTNAIEGNTLTLKETAKVLEGKQVKNARERDVREVKNMKQCIDYIFDYKEDISIDMILELHRIEQTGIMQDAGKFRVYNVRVGDYVCPDNSEVPKLMFEFIDWYNKNKAKMHPLELASLVHLKFVRIHPFGDGNGRMARLLMNLVMLKHSFPIINIFNDEKVYYYLMLRKYDADRKDKDFVNYLYEVFAKQYTEYV